MAEGTRLLALLSFLVLFIIGAPIWWKTTEIYRAKLPELAISHFKSDTWPTTIRIYLPKDVPSKELVEQVSARLQQFSTRATYTPAFKLELLSNPLSTTSGLTKEALDNQIHSTISNPSRVFLFVVFVSPEAPLQGEVTWGQYMHAVIRVRRSDAQAFDLIASTAHSMFGIELSPSEQRVVLPPSVEHRVSFTLASEDVFPENVPLSLFAEAITDYFTRFLSLIAPLGSFTVNSQTKQFVTPSKLPIRKQNTFQYTREMLPYFVNLAEWSSDSTSTEQGQVHFMLYLPASAHSPLQIYDNNEPLKSNAFIVPRTGAVAIKNIYAGPDQPPLGLTKSDFAQVIRIFIAQMRDLLGVHRWKAANIKTIYPKEGISSWELELLKRQHIWKNLQNATSSLQSVYKLVDAIPNMVVREEIRTRIVLAVDFVNNATHSIAAGNYDAALQASHEAFVLSEKVFFDPSMIAQLYFPDEHKYAIYIPMFFPMLLPVLTGLFGEIKRRKAKKKTD